MDSKCLRNLNLFLLFIIQPFFNKSMKTNKTTFLLWISLIGLFMICSTAFKMAEQSIKTQTLTFSEFIKMRKETIKSQRQHLQQKFNKNQYLRLANIKGIQNVFSNSKILPEANLTGNMIIVGRQALIPQSTDDDFPTLKKVNLDTMAVETIKYPRLDEWAMHQSLALADLQNGDIAYGAGSYILIIDRSTLKLKQTLQLEYIQDFVSAFDIFVDPRTSKSKLILETLNNHGTSRLIELKKKSGEMEYGLTFLTFAPLNKLIFKLTGLNKGITIDDHWINYWQNFDQIIDQSFDRKYFLQSKSKIAISCDQSIIVLRNNLSHYEFYTIAENYQMTLKHSLIISYNQHRKADFTTDDKYLFVATSNPRKINSIAKVIVDEGKFILITDSDGLSDNHVDFNLFASETNRMIVLALKGTTYVLQLRTISNLTILHELPLKFSFTVFNYKLVGSSEWGLTFALATQIAGDSKEPNLYQYSIVGDKIIASSISGKFNFDSMKACFKYFVSSDDNKVQIYSSSNFTLLSTIKTQSRYYTVDIVSHFMSFEEYQNYYFYDLSKSLDYQGVYYKSGDSLQQKMQLMLPKRRLLIDITTRQFFSKTVMRIIYNISEPQVKNIERMENRTFNIDAQTYYIPQVGRSCNKVFYISYNNTADDSSLLRWNTNPRLVEYDECSKNLRSVPIQFDKVWGSNMFLSSDNKYMIIIMQQFNQYQQDRFFIEIRALDQFEDIIMHKEFALGQFYEYKIQQYFMADLINGSKIFIKSKNFIFSADIEIKEKQNSLRQQI